MSGFYKLLSSVSNVAVRHNYFSHSVTYNDEMMDDLEDDDGVQMGNIEKEKCSMFMQKFANEVTSL